MIYRLYLLDKPNGKPERLLLESRDHLRILSRIQEEFRSGTGPEMLREVTELEDIDIDPKNWGLIC